MDAKKKKSSIGLCAVMVLLGLFYILNAGNFGKTLPAYWGFVAVPLGLAALFPAWRGRAQPFFACFALMQLPPILCWVQFGSNRFLAGDVQLLPYVGLPIHGALLAWSLWLLLRKK